jgi:hypothetical protein
MVFFRNLPGETEENDKDLSQDSQFQTESWTSDTWTQNTSVDNSTAILGR